MTKKNPKRSLQRKEQSERDKAKHLCDTSVYGQVAAFQQLLGLVQRQGMHGQYIPIPFELIDLTASFIASLISGSDFILVTPPLGDSLQAFRENVNFIKKTLSKAQISCSSLICSLWYIDQYFQHTTDIIKHAWNPRDLFIASIVVADKYLADVTWLNLDWSEWTHFTYSTAQINKLEKRFLSDMNFNLYISNVNYTNFTSYLEFRLHTRQLLLCGNVSYRDMDVLSQALNPEYVARLGLNLRPFQAMLLILKQALSILVMYAATLATLVSAGFYIIQQQSDAFIVYENECLFISPVAPPGGGGGGGVAMVAVAA
ncbi:uncharacterized protein EV154DRAFT_600230 [Mucor mucedo]|uniref:uncharacterized protein n=1 Tax=Mucor mucedo TaxID=29922 RepID=UPI00221EC56B|nr:uncharacterized protein EV154DRAFT_600230 [Mucor mucedo]KAI7894100.1 hypothetical protein EV154DRAFT_600230 [Mucor mucedo]